LKKLLLVAVLAILGELVGCSDAVFPYLTAIAVNPGTASVAAGRTQQFTAMGTFSNSQTKDITSLVTWTSSTAPVSTINSAGLAQSYSQGTSTITATLTGPAAGTVTGTGTFTVTAPALVAVIVTDATSVIPGSRTSLATTRIANGTGHQYVAYGIYSDGGERTLPNSITTSVTWASTPATVATISTTGRATSVAAGTATITATDPTSGTVSGPSSLVVTNAAIQGIEVYPIGAQASGLTMASNTRQPFAARGVFSDNTQQDVTVEANWTSTTPATATVSTTTPKGVVTAVALGTTQIQASLGPVTGAAPLVVTAASLTAITLTPAPATGATGVGVATGSILPIIAVGTFSDGSKQPINLAVAWSVTPSNGSIATVDPTGLVTGVAAGAATVSAKFGTITTNATINVQAIKSIGVGPTIPIVNPSILNVAQGTASQFVATATLADGTTQDISNSATWVAISPPAVSGTGPVATISDSPGSSGWATGNAPGTAIIGAIFGGQAGLSSVTTTNATLTTLAIAPTGNVHVVLGGTQQYQATGTFSDSTTQNLTNQVTWRSSLPTVAVMSLTGLATNTGVGTTNISAVGVINGNTATSNNAVFANP
jgi:trimeric autotransporter adhesin